MPVRVSPQDATSKWVSRLSGATAEIQAGVDRVTVSPGQSAVAKFQKWVNAITSADAQNKWKRNTGALQLSDWQSSMKNVGIPRIAQGAQAKQGKFESFMSDFLPFLARGVQQIESMDDSTFEARVQRAVAMMNYNRNFKRSGTQ